MDPSQLNSANGTIFGYLREMDSNKTSLFGSTKYCHDCSYLESMHNDWATMQAMPIFHCRVLPCLHTMFHVINLVKDHSNLVSETFMADIPPDFRKLWTTLQSEDISWNQLAADDIWKSHAILIRAARTLSGSASPLRLIQTPCRENQWALNTTNSAEPAAMCLLFLGFLV